MTRMKSLGRGDVARPNVQMLLQTWTRKIAKISKVNSYDVDIALLSRSVA